MKVKIKPLSSNVLIEVAENEEMLPSGIIIPDTAREKSTRGKVVAVGNYVDDVKPGDIVIYKRWGGTEIADSGKLYLLVDIEDILALT